MTKKEEFEKALLGAVILNNEQFDRAAERLKPTDFSEGLRRNIFEAMLILRARRFPIDAENIIEEMSRQETYDPVSSSEVSALVYGARSFADINMVINALLEVNQELSRESEWPEFIGQ